MARIDIKSSNTGGSGGGNLQLLNGAAMDATLRAVADTANTASPLKLSTGGVQTTTKLQITTADTNYIDAEDNSGNNRFTVGRDPASQQVNVDFASNPGGSTELVGGFRTYVDGTNLSNVVNIRRDGQLQIGSTAASAMYWDNTNNRVGIGTATPGVKLDVHSGADNIAQLNRTGAGKSLLQYLLTGTARWATGFDNTNGNYTIYDAVNATDRVVVTNTGNVGIGTNAPVNKLNIVGGDVQIGNSLTSGNFNPATYRTFTIGSDFSSGALQIGNGTTGLMWGGLYANINNVAVYANSRDLTFETPVEAMRITSGRNVGIGETTPTSRLHIKGSGSTSATTSLLVQNSAGTTALKVDDSCNTSIGASGISARLNIINTNGSVAAYIAGSGNGGVVEFNSISGAGIRCNDGYGNTNMFLGGLSTPSVSIGKASSAVASALLEMVSTTKGFLPPVMTTTQKNAIASPAAGLVVYDTTLNKLCVYTTAWETITSI